MKCAACPEEVRDLFACATNALGAYERGDGIERVARKMDELRRSLARMKPIVDAHFAELAEAKRDEHVTEPTS